MKHSSGGNASILGCEEETVFFSQLGVSPRAGGLETLGVADFFTAFESPGQQLSNEPWVIQKF